MNCEYVADLMTIDPVVVRADEPVGRAEELLRAYSISGLPVVDENGGLVGVISQSDLLWRGDLPLGVMVRRGTTSLRVGELMSSPAITVAMTDTLVAAARTMRDERVHRLVAVDEHGRPVGVISAFDFVELYADEQEAAPAG